MISSDLQALGFISLGEEAERRGHVMEGKDAKELWAAFIKRFSSAGCVVHTLRASSQPSRVLTTALRGDVPHPGHSSAPPSSWRLLVPVSFI